MGRSDLPKPLKPSSDVLYRIKRGLAGYVSYLAACEMNQSFSEYVLYEPTLRILTARGFTVKCEVPCPGFARKSTGDLKRIDFVADGNGAYFAIEMKWARTRKLDVSVDVEKLKCFRRSKNEALGFLCVFGKKSVLDGFILKPAGLREQGTAVYADFRKTRYGCRVYEVTDG